MGVGGVGSGLGGGGVVGGVGGVWWGCGGVVGCGGGCGGGVVVWWGVGGWWCGGVWGVLGVWWCGGVCRRGGIVRQRSRLEGTPFVKKMRQPACVSEPPNAKNSVTRPWLHYFRGLQGVWGVVGVWWGCGGGVVGVWWGCGGGVVGVWGVCWVGVGGAAIVPSPTHHHTIGPVWGEPQATLRPTRPWCSPAPTPFIRGGTREV